MENAVFKEPSAPLLQRNDACQGFGTDRGEGCPVLYYVKLALKVRVFVPGDNVICREGYM